MAGVLWEQWLPSSVRNLLSDGRDDDEIRAMARWLAGMHDVGKLSPAFACQVPHLADLMADTGLEFEVRRTTRHRTPHSVVSHSAVEMYLGGQGWEGEAARAVAVVAGGHHGVPPSISQVSSRMAADTDMRGGPRWDAVRNEFLDYITEISEARPYLDRWKDRPLTPQQQAVWTAVVIIADWLASDTARFPLQTPRHADTFATDALSELALPAPWEPSPDHDAATALSYCDVPTGAQPNSVQRATFEVAGQMNGRGLLIIEAEMGSGKTEAALLAAKQLGAAHGCGGVFMALPTMATSNAMFGRVLAWLRALPDLGLTSAVLAHGKADLNDDYRGLIPSAQLADIECDCGTENAPTVVAHQWLSGRKKSLLANFVVGTIDQLLFMALKSRHVVLRHLALAGKVVVIDEVHAADTYMRQYLIRALDWLGAYGVPVILLSATLPTAQRRAYAQAYAGMNPINARGLDALTDVGYPAITSVGADGRASSVSPPPTSESKRVEVLRLDDDADLAVLLGELLAEGGCAAIVRNTVRRAQDTAAQLHRAFGDDVLLLHSAFVAQHRARLETRLLGELGRSGTRPHRRIVVATQVIEQSLDFDFDVMISDLAPVDLLLQRLGRLHRHRRQRPQRLGTPRYFLTGVKDWQQNIPDPIDVSTKVYDPAYLLRALAVLTGTDHLTLPDDISPLVQAAYNDDYVGPEGWSGALDDAWSRSKTAGAEREARADAFRIWRPTANACLVNFLDFPASEPDDVHGYARVRDGNDSVEVLLTQRIGDRVFLPHQCGGEAVSVEHTPDDDQGRRALSAAIRLPYALSHPGIAFAVIEELERRTCAYGGWMKSRWLKGELALELDEDLTTQLCGYRVRYDDLAGLIVDRIDR